VVDLPIGDSEKDLSTDRLFLVVISGKHHRGREVKGGPKPGPPEQPRPASWNSGVNISNQLEAGTHTDNTCVSFVDYWKILGVYLEHSLLVVDLVFHHASAGRNRGLDHRPGTSYIIASVPVAIRCPMVSLQILAVMKKPNLTSNKPMEFKLPPFRRIHLTLELVCSTHSWLNSSEHKRPSWCWPSTNPAPPYLSWLFMTPNRSCSQDIDRSW